MAVRTLLSLFRTSYAGRFVFTSAMSALALIALGGAAQADVNLVQNGNFSTTTLTTSGQINTSNVSDWSSTPTCPGCYNFVYFPGFVTTSDPNGASDPSDPSQPGPNHEVWLYGPNNGASFPVDPFAGGGGNFLAADSDPSYNSAITQTINGLVIGNQYDLTFDWGAAQYTTRTGDTTDQWVVTLGNQTESTGVISDASQSFSGWQQASLLFTATSSTEVLSFLAVGAPGGEPPVAVLDNVQLTPEPGYYGLMFLGVAALVFAARRRSKATSRAV